MTEDKKMIRFRNELKQLIKRKENNELSTGSKTFNERLIRTMIRNFGRTEMKKISIGCIKYKD